MRGEKWKEEDKKETKERENLLFFFCRIRALSFFIFSRPHVSNLNREMRTIGTFIYLSQASNLMVLSDKKMFAEQDIATSLCPNLTHRFLLFVFSCLFFPFFFLCSFYSFFLILFFPAIFTIFSQTFNQVNYVKLQFDLPY